MSVVKTLSTHRKESIIKTDQEKKRKSHLKTEFNINLVIVGNFNTPLFQVNSLLGQNIRRETSELIEILQQVDLRDTNKYSYLNAKNAHSSQQHIEEFLKCTTF